MQCPECKSKLIVRETDDMGDVVERLRRCPDCGYRGLTTERWEKDLPKTRPYTRKVECTA